MKKLILGVLALGWIPTLAVVLGARWIAGEPAFAQGNTPFKVTRIYTGADGKTKVEEFEVPLDALDAGTDLSDAVAITGM